jgi:hypothetical protein
MGVLSSHQTATNLSCVHAVSAVVVLLLQTRHLSVTTELRRQLQEGADTPACLAAALEASEEARR